MWLMLNDAYFSIVKPDARDRKAKDILLVRARFEEDIPRVFPGHRVVKTPDRDYMFRTYVKAAVVKKALAAEVDRITYTNFKASVEEDWRHDGYQRVWGVMHSMQTRRHPKARGGRLPLLDDTEQRA